jgi:steroid delta-isomerase-like uncharacterized protein
MIDAMMRPRGCLGDRCQNRGRFVVRHFRLLLSVVVVMLLGIMASWGPLSAVAQEASPAASPVALSPLLQQWVDGVEAGDGDAIAALYTEDAVHEDVPADMVVEGPEEIGALVSGTVEQFDDVRYEVLAAHESGDLGILEYRFSATDLESGQPISIRGVYIFELAGDRIRRSADYYDVASILAQLGILDMGEEMAEATPAP